MKNSEIVSAVIGGTFFAVPYLALSVPVLPAIAIGAAAAVAGELVLKKDTKLSLKETNLPLYLVLDKAKKQNNHIFDMVPQLEDNTLKQTLYEINETVQKIIETVEKNPDKEKKLKNFFDYYLPVTVKLVDRFDEIENQKINTKDIENFNSSTIKTLNEINDVFKKFLNNLYMSDMTDTNVEIKVLNQMLKADGLDKNELIKKEEENE